MGKALAISVVLLAILAAGCIQPVVKLGCCLKENISEGCVLYNTTDFTNSSYIDRTNGPCDSNDTAYNTTGHCNVTINMGGSAGEKSFLVPICTQDDIRPCINQNCTTMVCGDFAYKPRFAPGFQTSGNDTSNPDSSVEASGGNIPPDTGEGGAAGFYKAQCRFLKMDAKLRQIMKSSKSQINVFRIGVGGSMDEFDQYRYYFPLSDRYCNINPGSEGEERVDRYMNYLTSSKTDYNPEADITTNCLKDGGASLFGSPNPFGFGESPAARASSISVAFGYSPVVPDESNYKFAHQAREDWFSSWDSGWGGYYYGGPSIRQDSVFKRIDEEYYRRELSIAHAATIYGETMANTTRAPFECDSRGNECYSGTCNTQFYSRGVLLTYPGLTGTVPPDEVVADCNRVSNENGKTIVVCAPTKSVSISPTPGVPPTFTYATVDVRPQHFEVELDNNDEYDYSSLTEEENVLDPFWDGFNTGQLGTKLTGHTRTITGTGYYTYWYFTQKRYCQSDYGTNNETTQVLCSSVSESWYKPPAGGVVFFGKQGEGNGVVYNGNKIIGYAISSPSDFKDIKFVKKCGINVSSDTETGDFVRVELDSMDDPDWAALQAAFKPYFQERLKSMTTGGFDDGCGDALQPVDAVLSAMPWVVNYQKGIRDADFLFSDTLEPISYHMSSTSAQALRKNNVYTEYMETWPGTSSCELRRTTLSWWLPVDLNFYYDVLFSRYIYLFKYTDGSSKLGNCAVDESDYLPTVRTYGWCEPCTTSTLAFQSISAHERVYMPAYTANVEGAGGTSIENICTAQYDTRWEGWLDFTHTDNVSCMNPRITDVNEYKESIGGIGSPRTSPEATILKERLGNYMKSGIMPVFDMTDASNWNMANPDAGTGGFWLFYDEAPATYQQYDFQRLFGEMGATVVIVNHISGDATDAQIEDIINRASVIHERCFGCLTAFHVDGPASNTSFNDSVNSVLSDTRANFAVDMVTFDYPISSHSSVFSGLSEPENRSEAIANDIASYGRVALQAKRKPTMVVGLNVRSDDGYWNDANYKILFEKIVRKQDEMVKNGVIGVIYSPARAASGTGTGIVSVDASGQGHKSEKFCAFQSAMQTMSTGAPVALFSRVNAVNTTNCTKCMSLDKVGTGVCSDYSRNDLGIDPKECDNGVICTVPEGMDSDEAKCQQGTIVDTEDSGCTLCNETGKMYTCTLRYTNGTVETIGPRPMTEVSSDMYLDIMAGISKPNKCCLNATNDKRYTYVKDAYQNSITKAIVFSSTGDPKMECNLGDPRTISELGSFCGIQLPLRDYDINCTLS
jgi:hypothetical protein